MKEDEYITVISREEITEQLVSVIACFLGGVLSLLTAIRGKGLLGLALPAIVLAAGIFILLAKNARGKLPGFIMTAAGAFGLLTRFVPYTRPLTGTLLGLCAFALFGAGIWKGIKLLFTLGKSRV